MGLPVARISSTQLQLDRSEMGRADTLRYNVLTYVVEESYERAVLELKKFRDADSEYPRFRQRIERYVNHAIDLVNAIRAKRRFPGMNSLTMAKQQEVSDMFRQHFTELQQILKKIEKVQTDLRIEDVRSTAYVVRALMISVAAIAISAFALEVSSGLLETTLYVLDDSLNSTVAWLFQVTGL
jgi:hypothetical protein